MCTALTIVPQLYIAGRELGKKEMERVVGCATTVQTWPMIEANVQAISARYCLESNKTTQTRDDL